MGTLQQYLVDRLINENHPTIEYDTCINNRQHRKTCTICKEVCPKGIIEDISNIHWEDCVNCDICVSQCPSRAIKSSAINLNKLLEVYGSVAGHVAIACRHREVSADCKVYCPASIPWEVIACLALDKQVSIFRADCDSCQDNSCLSAFKETMARVAEFLGEKRYRERIRIAEKDELPEIPLMSRREMFSLIGKRAWNMVGAVVPDDGSVKLDGMLYRKLLTKRVKELYEGGGQWSFGWRTPVFTEHCWGCGICTQVCPHGAITLLEADGERHMSHTLWKCGGCGACESVCLGNGRKGMRIEYVKNPLQPILTEVSCSSCEVCGKPVKPETGALCMVCARD